MDKTLSLQVPMIGSQFHKIITYNTIITQNYSQTQITLTQTHQTQLQLPYKKHFNTHVKT